MVGNVCLMYNSICFKNSPNKKDLGKIGCLDLLAKVFDHYSRLAVLNQETLKNCFKAIGNISLFFDNATIIISKNFVRSACEFVNQQVNFPDLVKFALDIFANLASFQEDMNRPNIDAMVKQGVIDTILNSIKQNELKSDLLLSSVTGLDNFCLNQAVKVLVSEKNGTEIVLRVLKSQDWNQDLVLKCLRILSNLASVKENVDQLIHHKVHQTIINIIKVQKEENSILLQCFSILSKICIDKPKCRIVHGAGLVDVAFEVIEGQTVSLENLINLFGILAKLARYSEEASEVICQKGAHSLFEIIQTRIGDQKLVINAMLLTEALSNRSANIDLITQSNGIQCVNVVLQKYTVLEDTILACFKCLSSIALANEDYRKMCVDLKCVDYIKPITESPAVRELVVTEGKLTIQNIMATKLEVPPEEDLNFTKGEKSLVTKEQKNFLIAGKICKLFKKDGSSKEMHIFMTPDLKEIMSKRPKKSQVKQQWRMPIHQIKETRFDYSKDKNLWNQSVFAKSGGLFKKKADPELTFALIGPLSLEGQRALYIECANAFEKKKWVDALQAVMDDYKASQRKKI